MPDPTPPPEPDAPDSGVVDTGASDPPEPNDPPLYDVSTGDTELPAYLVDQVYDLADRLAGLQLPRRHRQGRRGVLLADTDAGLVVLLDADDQAETFRVRAIRQLAGDPAALDPAPNGVDDLVRAAYESEYDVIAAPWVGDDTDAESAEASPRPRKRAARGKRGAE